MKPGNWTSVDDYDDDDHDDDDHDDDDKDDDDKDDDDKDDDDDEDEDDEGFFGFKDWLDRQKKFKVKAKEEIKKKAKGLFSGVKTIVSKIKSTFMGRMKFGGKSEGFNRRHHGHHGHHRRHHHHGHHRHRHHTRHHAHLLPPPFRKVRRFL